MNVSSRGERESIILPLLERVQEDLTDEQLETFVDSLTPEEAAICLEEWEATQLEPIEQATFEPTLRDVTVLPDIVAWVREVAGSRIQIRKLQEKVLRTLQLVAEGVIKRLIICMPPRHGKSELVSRLFVAYWLYCYPTRGAGIISYGAELAHDLSGESRAYYELAGRTITGISRREFWTTGAGGGCFGAGRGGTVLGRGLELLVVDDLFKQEETESPAVREKGYRWYEGTALSRFNSDQGAIVVVQQRLAVDDFIGHLMEKELESDYPEEWHCLFLDGIREDEPWVIPETCSVEKDWRKPGEALDPDRFGVEFIEKQALGTALGQSMYQQRPDRDERVGGRVVPVFEDAPPYVSEEAEYNPKMRIEVGIDFNVQPMVLVLAQYRDGRLMIFDVVEIDDARTQHASDYLAAKYPKKRIRVYPDPTGKARKTSSPSTDHQILKRRFPLVLPEKRLSFRDRENMVNRAVERGRVVVHPRCKALIDSWLNFRFKPGTREPMKGGAVDYSHAYDAASFPICHHFPLSKRAPKGVRKRKRYQA